MMFAQGREMNWAFDNLDGGDVFGTIHALPGEKDVDLIVPIIASCHIHQRLNPTLGRCLTSFAR
jgi:hypothetical protein